MGIQGSSMPAGTKDHLALSDHTEKPTKSFYRKAPEHPLYHSLPCMRPIPYRALQFSQITVCSSNHGIHWTNKFDSWRPHPAIQSTPPEDLWKGSKAALVAKAISTYTKCFLCCNMMANWYRLPRWYHNFNQTVIIQRRNR